LFSSRKALSNEPSLDPIWHLRFSGPPLPPALGMLRWLFSRLNDRFYDLIVSYKFKFYTSNPSKVILAFPDFWHTLYTYNTNVFIPFDDKD
jgi:hypothetical protein